MKKNLLIGIWVCVCTAVPGLAQLQKGTGYIGTTVTFDGSAGRPQVMNSTSAEVYNHLSINPSVQIGKFFRDHVMAGVGIGGPMSFSWTKRINPDGSDNKTRFIQGAYTLSPYLRHYKSLNSKWALFLTSAVDLAYLKIAQKNRNEKESWDGFSAGLRIVPGVSYWISPRFALETDVNLLSLGVGYKDFLDAKLFYFSSAATTGLPSYFSVRASWYLKKP